MNRITRRIAGVAATAFALSLLPAAPPASAAYSADCSQKKAVAGADVVLLIGQSNMAGYGYPWKQTLDAVPNPRINQWSRAGTVTAAVEPLQHWVWTADAQRTGMGFSFAQAYLATVPAQRTVLLVPAAYGGTGFVWHNWNPGDEIYEDAVARLTAALAADPGNCVAAVLWHQGESDVVAGMSQQAYASAFDAMIRNLRSRVPQARTAPLVVGEFTPEWIAANPASTAAVLGALRDAPNRIKRSAVASSAGLASNARAGFPADIIHFDARAMRNYGRRYFKALSAAANNLLPQ